MTAIRSLRFAIRGLDMANDTIEDLVQILMIAQKNSVTVDFTSTQGPNGHPVATFYSFTWANMKEVLTSYCGGDERATDNLLDMVSLVTDDLLDVSA